MKSITVEEALKCEHKVFIDVRSESEYEEGAIPGAVSIPLFHNAERAAVGTLYKQKGSREAKEKGLEIAARKLMDIYQQLKPFHMEGMKIIIYCWRGGMRSGSVSTLMEMMDLYVCRMEGGYKAYRKTVLEDFEKWEGKKNFIVLHGTTGVGKTDLLDKLEQKGYPVLNLEKLAGHRGSVFGGVGLGLQPSQKDFEARIHQKIREIKEEPIFVEAESSRIGKCIIPSFVKSGIQQGARIWIDCSQEVRIQRLLQTYIKQDPEGNAVKIQAALQHLKPSISNQVYLELEKSLLEKQYEKTCQLLLDYYYDPLYNRGRDRCSSAITKEIDATCFELGIEALENIFHTHRVSSIDIA